MPWEGTACVPGPLGGSDRWGQLDRRVIDPPDPEAAGRILPSGAARDNCGVFPIATLLRQRRRATGALAVSPDRQARPPDGCAPCGPLCAAGDPGAQGVPSSGSRTRSTP